VVDRVFAEDTVFVVDKHNDMVDEVDKEDIFFVDRVFVVDRVFAEDKHSDMVAEVDK
jgi:hypothetical protein